MNMENLELFCKYNSLKISDIKTLLNRNSVKLDDLLLIDDVQFPTLHSQFDSWMFNYRVFLTQVNRYLKTGKDIYTPKYMILFHGTSGRNVESIEANGLLTTTNKMRNSLQSTNGYVYLAPMYNYAYDFGRFVNPNDVAVFAVLCKVNQLSIDTEQIKNKRVFKADVDIKETLADSLWFGHSVRVHSRIDVSQIIYLA